MDFFEHQQVARQATARLIFYFVLAVLSIIATLYAVVVLIDYFSTSDKPDRPELWIAFQNPGLLISISITTLTIVIFGSVNKMIQIRSGGPAIAESLGARPVSTETLDHRERRLMNVVEEMAIASGTPMPAVYTMDDEQGINAFAAGFSVDNAVVAVSRGALTRLNRAELQGVIAHEFSHILNGDMRLNIWLIGVLHGILLIAVWGYAFLRGGTTVRSQSQENSRVIAVILGIVLLTVGYLGVFFGRLIKASVSREREFLADASAVQFTRNPDGIAGALKKIGGGAGGSTLEAPFAETASHLYFATGVTALSADIFATHPPIDERIRRIDPHWRGNLSASTTGSLDTGRFGTEEALSLTVGLTGPESSATRAPSPLTPEDAVAHAGRLLPVQMDLARGLLRRVPQELLDAAHSPHGARALALSMVIDQDQTVWDRQLEMLKHYADPDVLGSLQKIHPAVGDLPRQSLLPLMTLCIASLRSLSARQYREFDAVLEKLIDADGIRDAFEFALLRVLRRHLDQQADSRKRSGTTRWRLGGLSRECGVLLSALARIGHDDPTAANAAFQAGTAQLELVPPPAMTADDTVDFAAVDAALDRLETAAPPGKRKIIAACAAAIASDGRITVEEGEILRMVCDSLDVPMPPFPESL